MTAFLDTSILIEFERGFFKLRDLGAVTVPAMALAEFVRGIESAPNPSIRSRGERFLARQIAPLGVVPFGFAEARAWAALGVALQRSGQSMKFGDSLIAAQCIAQNVPLVTCDEDFDRIPGLTLIQIKFKDQSN